MSWNKLSWPSLMHDHRNLLEGEGNITRPQLGHTVHELRFEPGCFRIEEEFHPHYRENRLPTLLRWYSISLWQYGIYTDHCPQNKCYGVWGYECMRSDVSSVQTGCFCTQSFRWLVWLGTLYVFCINSTASLFCVARYRVDLLHALNCFIEQCREVICGSV